MPKRSESDAIQVRKASAPLCCSRHAIILTTLRLRSPARGFDATCQGFELVEAEFSVEAISVVGHRSWLKLCGWGMSPMYTPSPQSMHRVMMQVQLSCDLAPTGLKPLKTPPRDGEKVLSGDR